MALGCQCRGHPHCLQGQTKRDVRVVRSACAHARRGAQNAWCILIRELHIFSFAYTDARNLGQGSDLSLLSTESLGTLDVHLFLPSLSTSLSLRQACSIIKFWVMSSSQNTVKNIDSRSRRKHCWINNSLMHVEAETREEKNGVRFAETTNPHRQRDTHTRLVSLNKNTTSKWTKRRERSTTEGLHVIRNKPTSNLMHFNLSGTRETDREILRISGFTQFCVFFFVSYYSHLFIFVLAPSYVQGSRTQMYEEPRFSKIVRKRTKRRDTKEVVFKWFRFCYRNLTFNERDRRKQKI